uniref:SOS1 n=1 Tax=Rhizophora mucronata TaxID=61149 RepID=A0A2P2LR80_RHIMU
MGPLASSVRFCAAIPVCSCWSVVSLFTLFWLWFGLEGSYNSHMVRSARGCCIVSFTNY